MMRALLALVLLGSAAAFTPSMRPARAATSTTSLAAKSKSVPFLEQPAKVCRLCAPTTTHHCRPPPTDHRLFPQAGRQHGR